MYITATLKLMNVSRLRCIDNTRGTIDLKMVIFHGIFKTIPQWSYLAAGYVIHGHIKWIVLYWQKFVLANSKNLYSSLPMVQPCHDTVP